VVACRQWAATVQAAGRHVVVPEIPDYEVRRELLPANKSRSLALPDQLAQQLDYLPLTTAALRKAAELWIVATGNVAHVSRFVPAELWQNISP
jgi:hypothetical protein